MDSVTLSSVLITRIRLFHREPKGQFRGEGLPRTGGIHLACVWSTGLGRRVWNLWQSGQRCEVLSIGRHVVFDGQTVAGQPRPVGTRLDRRRPALPSRHVPEELSIAG